MINEKCHCGRSVAKTRNPPIKKGVIPCLIRDSQIIRGWRIKPAMTASQFSF